MGDPSFVPRKSRSRYKEKMIQKDPTFKFFRKEDTEPKKDVDWSIYEIGARCEVCSSPFACHHLLLNLSSPGIVNVSTL